MKFKYNKKTKEERDWIYRSGKPSKYNKTEMDNMRRLANGSIVKGYAKK